MKYMSVLDMYFILCRRQRMKYMSNTDKSPQYWEYWGLSFCAFTVHEPRLVAVICRCLTI